MNTIKRDVYVLKNTIKIPIEVTKGTDAITFEFAVRDYNLPVTAGAVAYAYHKSMKKPNSALCDVSGNVISFQPSANFFEVGMNELQIRAINEDKSLISFKEKVKCSDSMGFPDEEEEENQSLIEQIIAQSGKESGERKAADEKERSERKAADETEKSERIAADVKEKSERQKEIATERARIDQLTKMGEGSTTGDSELADIRVGNEGATYSNAGNAVRFQTKDVPAVLDNLQSPYVDISLLEQGSLNNTGSEIASSKVLRSIEFRWNKDGGITAPTGYEIAIANYAMQADESGQMLQVYQSVTDYAGGWKRTSKADGDTEFRRLLIKRSDGADISAEDLRGKIATNVPGLRAMDVLESLKKDVGDMSNDTKTLLNDAKQMKEDLADTNIYSDLLKEIVWHDGTFIANSGVEIELAGYSKSEPMKINGGTKIKYKAQGYEKNVAMISQYKEEKYIPLVISRTSELEEYEYTVDENGYYVFSALKTSIEYVKTVAVIDKTMPSIASETVKENNNEHGIEANVNITGTQGSYVAHNGAVVELNGYFISNQITLPPKTKIKYKGQGYEKNVAMISQYKGGKYVPLVISKSSELEEYEYVSESKINIVLSGTNLKNSSASMSLNILESICEISSELDNISNENNIIDYVSLSLFSKFGVIGDSYASGEIYDQSQNPYDKYNISWGQILARKLGTECINYSEGGLTTRTWLNSSRGLALLNKNEAQGIYYLCLGINDVLSGGNNYLGTVSDIEKKSDTFYGNYGKIINAIKTHAPNAKMMIFTVALTGDTANKFNKAILEIADYFKIPSIDQFNDAFFTSEFYLKNQVAGHPIAIVYSGMANAFERLIKKCITENTEYFRYLYAYK